MYEEHEKKLNDLIFKLLTNTKYMFYGLFLSEVNKSFSTRIPTACLGKHPNASVPIMLFNPEFWANLKTDEEKTFLLLHETCHYIYESFYWHKEFNWEKLLSNLAMD